MSIVVLGTHIFEGSQNNVDTPLSGQLALGFDQNNELSVKDSDGNVWQVGSPTVITNKLVQITLDDMELSSFDDFTTALLATYINSLNISVVAGENYYFEVTSSDDLRMLFILKENVVGIIDIDQTQLINIVELVDISISGDANKISKFNSSGDNITESSISDNGSNVLVENPLEIDSLIPETSGLKFTNLKNSTQGEESILGTTGLFPSGLAADSSGNIFVVNYGDNNVTKITPDGVSSIFATTGSEPQHIAIDSSDNLYVTNNGTSNVSKITPGGVSTILGTTGTFAYGIVLDTAGNSYIACRGTNNVTKITPGGVSTVLGNTGTQVADIAIDSLGNIYTANQGGNNVTKITPGGVSTTFATTGDYPSALAVDSLNNLFVCNTNDNTISKITSSGVSTIFATGAVMPSNIVIGSDDNIYVACAGDNTVMKITPLGVTSTLGETGTDPYGMTIDFENSIFIGNYGNATVTKITQPSNKVLTLDGDGNVVKNTDVVVTSINGVKPNSSGNVEITISNPVSDATTSLKGILMLAGDLGGTADLPTTPTALHKTGNETKTGTLSLITPNVTAGTSSLNAITPLVVTGGNGGNNTNTSGSVIAGNAANIQIKAGIGGSSTSSGTAIGGKGGDVKIEGGDGGFAFGTGTLAPGNGGWATVQAGSAYGGIPGNSDIKAGNNNIPGGVGGNVYLTAGWGNNSSVSSAIYDGTIFLGVSGSNAIRGNIVIGDILDDRVNKLQVNGTGKFSGNIMGNSFIKSGGTSAQFLKADGSIDSTVYATPTTQANISANITLNSTHDNCILKIKGNCTITIPSTLPTDFNCVIRTFTGFTATFVGGAGVTMDAPQGLVLAPTKMATLFKDGSTATYILEGELTV